MCGRYTLAADIAEIMDMFGIDELAYEYSENYNVAPSHRIAGIVEHNGKRILKGFHWGLVPYWAKDIKIGYKMINARAETLLEKPSFRNLVSRKRTIIPADGFYEWMKIGKDKQPYRFQLKNKGLYGFAGLWDEWASPTGEQLQSCTIITTTPNELVADVHDRMPVILDTEEVAVWLSSEKDTDCLQTLLRPYPAEKMIKYPVSQSVGSVKNSGRDLIAEVAINSK
ncbi:SOS response-associated peptidase [Paenibacillus puerhi]|uniref:SOS response-associated peptidase n=1 Tax=Paenibacillus puerhi TaxID=2692622 RepID=UPI00135A7299|nr:SOS response-associated peptidase [Paenibacillus puerhi]